MFPPQHFSVPRINSVPKHPKILALLHYNKPPTCEPSSCKLSMSGLSETAACPPSPIADDPSALPSPIFSRPPVSNSFCLFTGCQPLYASCCTIQLYFSRSCTVKLKMFSLFFVFVFLCIICVKAIINLLHYGTV